MGSLLGFQWSCQMELPFNETQNNDQLTYTEASRASKLAVWEFLHLGTEPNNSQQVWCIGTQLELILD